MKDKQIWDQLREVPRVSNLIVAGVCLALNFLLPGSGTLVAACADVGDIVSKT